MSYIVLNGWTDFWDSVGAFFKGIFDTLYTDWINPPSGQPYLAVFLFGLLILFLGIVFIKVLTHILRKVLRVEKKFTKDRTLKSFLVNTIRVVLYILLIILFLGILGANLSGIATVFSSAILAVGLALQDVVGNFASGIIILTSKPFIIDDYVSFPEKGVEGTVTDVRFLTTYLNTIDNQVVIIPNKNVTSTTIVNYTTNPKRRINIVIGVEYDTDIDLAKKVVLDVIKKDKRVLKDPAPVAYLVNFGASSLDISVRCWVNNDQYWDMVFNFREQFLKEYRKNNISIAFNHLDICDVTNKKIDIDNKDNLRKIEKSPSKTKSKGKGK